MKTENPGIAKPLLTALDGKPSRRPPIWLMRQAGRYLPEYRAVRADAGSFLDLCLDPARATEVTLQPIRRFGLDAAILFSDILVVPYALGQKLAYVEGEGPQLDPVRDTAGLSELNWKIDRLDPVFETVERVRSALPEQVTLIGFAGAPWTVAAYMVEGEGSRDYVQPKGWALRDPDGFGKLIDLLVECTIDYLARQVEAGAEVIQLFDSWAGVLAADQFDRWVIEPTCTIVDALKARFPSLKIIGFPRGAGTLLPRYAEATGVDAVGLDTQVPPLWAREAMPEMPLQGNLDPIRLLVGGSAMEQGIEAILAALDGHPFVFNLGHGVLPSTPPQHVARLVELVRQR